MLLEIRDVSAGYGQGLALDGVSLTVGAGELVGVLGANGAGKTTLARVIAGDLALMTGDIVFDGSSLASMAPERRARLGIAHVPQGRRVFPDLSVSENLAVARFAAGSRARAETTEFVFGVFPRLRDLAQRRGGLLSGGEQQMVAVARALLCEPRLIVLDEPSLGLAPVLVADMYRAFAEIRGRGISMILAEQAVGAVLGLADRVAVLEGGRRTRLATATELAAESDLAARYLGGRDVSVERPA